MDGMRISELARRSGVPASTLRYYEAEGLLPAERADNGYRTYGPEALDRLAFIAQAKHLSVPLADVRELVTAWESQPCRRVREAYRPLLTDRLRESRERLVALQGLQVALVTAIEGLDALPDRDGPCDAGCASPDGPHEDMPVADIEGPPVACTLGSGDFTSRVSDWRDLLAPAQISKVDGGLRATLATSELERTAALAVAEQRCCAFYAVRLDLHGATFDLTFTAPPEAAGMLADLVPATGAEPR